MRTAIRLDCSHPDYDWVNRALFVSSGGKVGTQVLLDVYHVLGSQTENYSTLRIVQLARKLDENNSTVHRTDR